MIDDLNNKLDKIVEKLDTMSDSMVVIQVSQGRMEENLKEHMRRSQAAEDNIAILHEEIEPLKEHATQVRTVAKLAMWVIGGIGALIAAFIAHFKS